MHADGRSREPDIRYLRKFALISGEDFSLILWTAAQSVVV